MSRLLSICLLFLLSCSADKAKEALVALPAQEDSSTLAQVGDSVRKPRQDGTDTNAGLPVDVKQQLPAELEVYLDRTHGLWQFPLLPDQQVQRVPRQEQGPYYLQADFNNDKKMDYAIQIVEKDTAFIYVFLKAKTGDDFEVHQLEKNRLLQMEGKKRSNKYLVLGKKSDKYIDPSTQKEITLPQDAVSVVTDADLFMYVLENGKFLKKGKLKSAKDSL